MFGQLAQRSNEPFHVRARRYFVDYRKQFPGLALILLLIYLDLGLIGAPFGFRSSFDGVWLAEQPSGELPGSISVRLKNGHFSETWPSGDYEATQLDVDGKQHPWTEYGSAPFRSYRAILQGKTLEITREARDGNLSVERWSIQDHGHRLIISSASGDAVYRHASWLRSMIRSDP
jgi:hypothetical protein